MEYEGGGQETRSNPWLAELQQDMFVEINPADASARGVNRRRVVTINDGLPGERSVSMACMHCTDAPCAAVCPMDCFSTTDDAVVLHSKDTCIGCGYCFYACPFGAPQYPKVGNFGTRGKMDKCTYCAGGPEADMTEAEYVKYGSNRLAEGKLPLCAEMCSTKSLLAFAGLTTPAQAQQINPTEKSITEDQLFQSLQGDDAMVAGRVSIPDELSSGLIKPGNKSWAGTHTGTVRTATILAVVGALLVLLVFYLVRGKIMIDGKMSGIRILRFTAIERFAHWLMAGSFMVLALTGLNLVLGRTRILPRLGKGPFRPFHIGAKSRITMWHGPLCSG